MLVFAAFALVCLLSGAVRCIRCISRRSRRNNRRTTHRLAPPPRASATISHPVRVEMVTQLMGTGLAYRWTCPSISGIKFPVVAANELRATDFASVSTLQGWLHVVSPGLSTTFVEKIFGSFLDSRVMQSLSKQASMSHVTCPYVTCRM